MLQTSTHLTKLLSGFIFITVGLIILSPFTAGAQTAGVSLSPAVIEETLDPGTSKTYEIEVVNRNPVEQEFFLFTRNIRSVGTGGVPIFADTNQEVTGFELADWVVLPDVGSITLPVNGRETISFQLNVPDNASPGSHFGGIFVAAEPPDMETSGAAVGYQVATIVSIRVSGDADEQASIRQFSTDKFLYGSQDVGFNVRIENSGNVLVRPVGTLQINNALGRQVGEVTFNDSTAGVFPGDTREFSDIRWIGDSVGFGRYEVLLTAGYGDVGARKTISSTVTFWILPFNIIGPALGVLAFILIVTIIAVRMYIKRALAQMNVGRRMVRRKNQGGPSMSLLLIVSVLIVLALFLLVMLVLFA